MWGHDSWYSLGLFESGLIGNGSLRIGISHYNTEEEVLRLTSALDEISR